jgi:octaprenyl-diphosphate synthase
LTSDRNLAAASRPSKSSAASLIGLVAEKLAATEELLHRKVASDVPFIHNAADYIFDSGGKRMRPALLLLCNRMLGNKGLEDVTYAAVVELIHTATLIHDDIIDHAALRRGRETLNHLWGNSQTVLLGDWLYTTAMRMALAHDNLEVIRTLCSATLKMTEGELLSLQRLGDIDITVEEYFDIIERKTAYLFAAACAVPTYIEPDRPEARDVLTRYGRKLGICFQLVDDLLDFTARETEVGKPVLSDLKEGKLTLPLILLLPRVSPAEKAKIQTVLQDRAFNRVGAEEILELVRSQGTLEEVEEMASRFAAEAQDELSFFPPSRARDALDLAPDFVLNRRS